MIFGNKGHIVILTVIVFLIILGFLSYSCAFAFCVSIYVWCLLCSQEDVCVMLHILKALCHDCCPCV